MIIGSQKPPATQPHVHACALAVLREGKERQIRETMGQKEEKRIRRNRRKEKRRRRKERRSKKRGKKCRKETSQC